MLREVRGMIPPPADASRPITSLTTPCPAPSCETDASPASATVVAKEGSGKIAAKTSAKVVAKVVAKTSAKVVAKTKRRGRVSRKAIVTLAMATGIGLGLWHDDVGRSDLTDELGRAANAISTFVVESLIR
jgi:hypothetical protein